VVLRFNVLSPADCALVYDLHRLSDNKDYDHQNITNGGVTSWDLEKCEQFKPIQEKLLSCVPDPVISSSFHAISYSPGSYNKMHTDSFQWTIITLIYGQYEGGELVVGDEVVDLEMGDTILFPEKTKHGVLPMESGQRTVLVGWINPRRNNKA